MLKCNTECAFFRKYPAANTSSVTLDRCSRRDSSQQPDLVTSCVFLTLHTASLYISWRSSGNASSSAVSQSVSQSASEPASHLVRKTEYRSWQKTYFDFVSVYIVVGGIVITTHLSAAASFSFAAEIVSCVSVRLCNVNANTCLKEQKQQKSNKKNLRRLEAAVAGKRTLRCIKTKATKTKSIK